jgi:hypothetical protein
MNEQEVLNFVQEYVEGSDLMNCVDFALGHDFEEPDDYESYGCRIDFLSKEETSVTDEDALAEWYVSHSNKYLKPKVSADDPRGFSFPPTFNFPQEEDFTVESIEDEKAEVLVEGTEDYTFVVERDESEEEGIIITAITFSVWGADQDLLQ